EFEGNRAKALILRDGERIKAESIISAVPYFSLKDLLPEQVANATESFRNVSRFESAPIVSINLWYDEPVTDLEFTGLLDSPIEWVFNKNAIGESKSKRQHLALVISGAHTAAKMPKEKLVELAINEMTRFFPAARKQQPINSFVIREHHATISHTVGIARLRPSQRTPFLNFFLAGDWTATGLPATIEGAVWSGQECARMIIPKKQSSST
ncbi:MAG TPA: FAD-dependent oxidoreductase, partial [Blastocatellia bacterium]|nr:FAD-dependent oxidoreductase [Blastocatellia bacterium]